MPDETGRGTAIEFDPHLVEEAVLISLERAARDHRRRFRQERDALYLLTDPDDREARFDDLHSRWFVSLRLAEPVRAALAEQPGLLGTGSRVRRCLVLTSGSGRDEGADLHDDRRSGTAQAGGVVLIIRLLPTTLLDGGATRALLRRELAHVADMLDPDFGYTHAMPALEGSRAGLIRERYRILWDTSVDGRLAARGALGPGRDRIRRREVIAAFPARSGEEALFERLFFGPRPTHEQLWSLALGPGSSAPGPGGPASGRCPLCAFPTSAFHPDPSQLGLDVLEAIAGDFPSWRASDGLCVQCSDLYSSRVGPPAPAS